MASLTNKNLDFLSNEELINILHSILDEIDIVASCAANRSTTYLAVSAVEGLFGEILKLKSLLPDGLNRPKEWPVDKNGVPFALKDVNLKQRQIILKAAKALPKDFEKLFTPLIDFRNYMHPDRELINQTPIAQSVSQRALFCLNELTEMYRFLRFIGGYEWNLETGIAKVPANNVIQMPAIGADPVSILISRLSAERLEEIKFRVIIPPHAIFNFIYNYISQKSFMGARIEGRTTTEGKGLDNGRLVCTGWRVWSIHGQYTRDTEPDARKQIHTVKIVLSRRGTFTMIVDDKQLVLDDAITWDFDPQERVGFMTEHGAVIIADLEIATR